MYDVEEGVDIELRVVFGAFAERFALVAVINRLDV